MNYKEFPGTRTCAIDYYPLFLEALKDTYLICKKYNIPFKVKGKGSADVAKFFYHYCLDKFCTAHKKCQSKYPKVIVFYPPPDDVLFTDKNLDQIIKVLPILWCKVHNFNSPDTEMAVLNAVQKNKVPASKIHNFANKHALTAFIKQAKKIKHFSVGTVDLSPSTE